MLFYQIEGLADILRDLPSSDSIRAEGTDCKCVSIRALKKWPLRDWRHIRDICTRRTAFCNSRKITPKIFVYLFSECSQKLAQSLYCLQKLIYITGILLLRRSTSAGILLWDTRGKNIVVTFMSTLCTRLEPWRQKLGLLVSVYYKKWHHNETFNRFRNKMAFLNS